jgi:hypothetical protein
LDLTARWREGVGSVAAQQEVNRRRPHS